MSLVSVIVPVYKVEKYLCRCVDSILTQTFSDFELILVDDGSPDRSGKMCDEYAAKDNRIRVIHKENGGLSSARNAGIDIAKGKYLFFVDSDDMIHPECLNLLIQCISDNNAQIASGAFARFTEDIPSSKFETVMDRGFMRVNSVEALGLIYDDDFSFQRTVSSCCKLYDTNLFKDIRFPLGKLFEDEHIIHELYYNAESVVFTNSVLYYYFVNENGITNNLTVNQSIDEHEAQWKRVCFFHEKQLYELRNKAIFVFLSSSKWDLIACRNDPLLTSTMRKARFEEQFLYVFNLAHRHRILEFERDYDYYVLAKPRMIGWWRIKRQLSLLLKKV